MCPTLDGVGGLSAPVNIRKLQADDIYTPQSCPILSAPRSPSAAEISELHYRRYSRRDVKGNDTAGFGERPDKIGNHYCGLHNTNASVRGKSPTQILRDMSRQLRKEIYKNAFELSEKFPEKPSLEAGLEEEIAYTEELLRALEEGIAAYGNRKIQ